MARTWAAPADLGGPQHGRGVGTTRLGRGPREVSGEVRSAGTPAPGSRHVPIHHWRQRVAAAGGPGALSSLRPWAPVFQDGRGVSEKLRPLEGTPDGRASRRGPLGRGNAAVARPGPAAHARR